MNTTLTRSPIRPAAPRRRPRIAAAPHEFCRKKGLAGHAPPEGDRSPCATSEAVRRRRRRRTDGADSTGPGPHGTARRRSRRMPISSADGPISRARGWPADGSTEKRRGVAADEKQNTRPATGRATQRRAYRPGVRGSRLGRPCVEWHERDWGVEESHDGRQ